MVLLIEAPSEVNPTTSPPESSINKIALTTNLARLTPVNIYNNFILSRYFYSIKKNIILLPFTGPCEANTVTGCATFSPRLCHIKTNTNPWLVFKLLSCLDSISSPQSSNPVYVSVLLLTLILSRKKISSNKSMPLR